MQGSTNCDIMMDGSCFSFLNDNEYVFAVEEGQIQGRIARLNSQMARIYFVRTYIDTNNNNNAMELMMVDTPSDIEVKDMTLKENAPRVPPSGNPLLLWTSDYEIHYKGRLLVRLKMQRRYDCACRT